MEKLKDSDVVKVLSKLREVSGGLAIDIMKTEKVVLAGGFIRSVIDNDEINDIDLFMKKDVIIEDIVDKCDVQTDNSYIIFKDKPVQIIKHKWKFDDPCELIEQFDYVITMAAVWFENGEINSVCNDFYYDDIKCKELTMFRVHDKIETCKSLVRSVKFTKHGYSFEIETLYKMIESISGKELTDDESEEIGFGY